MMSSSNALLDEHSTLSDAVTKIISTSSLTEVLGDLAVQTFLFRLGKYQFRHLLDIENLLIGIHKSGFDLNKDDPLYQILLLDLVTEQIRRMKIKHVLIESNIDGVLNIYKSSRGIISNKTQGGFANDMRVKDARITEWKKGRKVPEYIEASIQNLLDVPVWCYTESRRN